MVYVVRALIPEGGKATFTAQKEDAERRIRERPIRRSGPRRSTTVGPPSPDSRNRSWRPRPIAAWTVILLRVSSRPLICRHGARRRRASCRQISPGCCRKRRNTPHSDAACLRPPAYVHCGSEGLTPSNPRSRSSSAVSFRLQGAFRLPARFT
jgi:hypothetical protein